MSAPADPPWLVDIFGWIEEVFAAQGTLAPVGLLVERPRNDEPVRARSIESGGDVSGNELLGPLLEVLKDDAARIRPWCVLVYAEVWHRRRVSTTNVDALPPLAEDPAAEEAVMCCGRSLAWPERDRVWFAPILRDAGAAPKLGPFVLEDDLAPGMTGRIWAALRVALPPASPAN